MEELIERIKQKQVAISVVGLGYVGLSVACVFAWKGFRIYGFDTDKSKVDALRQGVNYIDEELWVSDVLKRYGSCMTFSTDIAEASSLGDVVIVTVPTHATGTTDFDLSCLVSAYNSIIKGGVRGKLLITESTVPPGTTEGLIKPMLENATGLRAGKDFLLAFSPERIDVGNSNHKIWNIPKVVGGVDEVSSEAAYWLYNQITDKVVKVSTATTAELVKVMENAQRDVNIALTNLFALIAEKLGVDIEEALNAAATKWNFIRMKPGCGVGGYCIGPATCMLISVGKRMSIDTSLLEAARSINDSMPAHVVDLAVKAIEKKGIRASDAKISVLGLGYKRNLKDTRNSPALKIIDLLRKKGIYDIIVYDPLLKKVEGEGVKVAQSINEAIRKRDCIIIATDHDAFRNIDLPEDTIVIDGRNILSPYSRVKTYYGIGRAIFFK
ncbi:MAG: nucleotide sugar dehydrogenase [Candidatus Jordarchaeales archaeon]|nr:nucleotide sugar dehydrogenase [Candidatus Jordarchaeia archaeon]